MKRKGKEGKGTKKQRKKRRKKERNEETKRKEKVEENHAKNFGKNNNYIYCSKLSYIKKDKFINGVNSGNEFCKSYSLMKN